MRSNLISISISIHALREEGDSLSEAITKLKADFYPRPPRGGRLIATAAMIIIPAISIHALREEGDNPGLPQRLDVVEFLSTPSARRATSIQWAIAPVNGNFYPRPPRGGRHPRLSLLDEHREISIHALREEGDRFFPFSYAHSL